MPLSLRALVPTAPKISGIETSNAEFRVKRGQVSINVSATIGAGSLVDGGFSKNTPDGVFVNDGFAGNLQIGNSKETINYTGNGTLYATGDISISSNFLPKSGHTFPTTARVGPIARRNMNLATGNGDAQLSMAGAFYAQGTVRSAKQNQIAGTFVANHFDMGTNVPNIYQVPSLVQNMPPSMPGDKMMLSLRMRSWRERGRGVATDQLVSASGNQTQ